MPILRGMAGGVALGVTAGGGTLGTAVAASHLIQCDAFGEAGESTNYDTRTQALAGKEEGTGVHFVESVPMSFTLSGVLDDLNAAILFALVGGSDAVTGLGTNTKQHVSTPVGSDTELPYFSVYMKHTPVADTASLGSVTFDTCILNTLTVSGTAGQPLRYSAEILTTGQVSSNTTDISGLVKPNIAMFRFANQQFVYTTGTPTAVSGDPGTGLGTISGFGGGSGNGWASNADLSTALNAFSLTINNNAQALQAGGQTTGTAAALFRTQRIVTMSSSFHFQHGTMSVGFRGLPASMDSSITTYGVVLRNITGSVLDSGSYNYGMEQLMPNFSITGVEMDKTFGPRGMTITGVASSTASLSSIYPHVWTSVATDFA